MSRPPCPPSCPRCGYDFSGAIAAWEERCPLSGVCTECGLDLWWGDVLNPAITVPRWSFEHAHRRRLPKLFLSIGCALAPPALWKRLRMQHPIHVGRLAALMLACLMLAHLLLGAQQAQVAWHFAKESGVAASAPQAAAQAAPSLLWPYSPRYFGVGWLERIAPAPVNAAALAILAQLMVAPIVFLLLPDSLRRARVRRLHLVRGCAYTLAIVPVLAAGDGVVALLDQFGVITRPWRRGETPLYDAGLVATAIAWQWLYWWMFAGRYLRLPHSALVALVVVILPALSIVTAAFVIDGSFAWRWVHGWWYDVTDALKWLIRGFG